MKDLCWCEDSIVRKSKSDFLCKPNTDTFRLQRRQKPEIWHPKNNRKLQYKHLNMTWSLWFFWLLARGNKTICFLRWWNCVRFIVCEGVHFIMGNRACSIEKIHMTTLFSRVCVCCCATVFYCFVSMSMSGLETSLFTALFSHVSFFFYMAKFGQRQTVCMG